MLYSSVGIFFELDVNFDQKKSITYYWIFKQAPMPISYFLTNIHMYHTKH